MFEVQMLIPFNDNDGNTFSAEHHAAFEAALLDSFGGFTLYPSSAVGGWRNTDGKAFADSTRIYGIAVPSLSEGDKVGELARLAKSHYCQEAIAIRYLGQFEIL